MAPRACTFGHPRLTKSEVCVTNIVPTVESNLAPNEQQHQATNNIPNGQHKQHPHEPDKQLARPNGNNPNEQAQQSGRSAYLNNPGDQTQKANKTAAPPKQVLDVVAAGGAGIAVVCLGRRLLERDWCSVCCLARGVRGESCPRIGVFNQVCL